MRYTTRIAAVFALACATVLPSFAQEYVSPVNPARTGRAPGVRFKLVGEEGAVKTYMLVFAPGDEIVSGLTEFVQAHDIRAARITAIGDATSAKVGWYDASRKMFRVIPIDEPAEITSLMGDVAVFNGKTGVHVHINLATSDGLVHGGHLIEAFVYPTLEVLITAYPTPLIKEMHESGAATIHPEK